MWCDHPFSQRNKETERTFGLGIGGDMERPGDWKKIEKEK